MNHSPLLWTVKTLGLLILMNGLAPATLAQPPIPNSETTFLLRADHRSSLDAFAKEQIQSGLIAGISYGLWQRGDLLQIGQYGPSDENEAPEVGEETLYQIYSMTKPITAVGMMILNERGHFDLDDPISDVLPEFSGVEVVADFDSDDDLYTYRPPRGPTYRELLSHTAGFAYQSKNRSPSDRKYIELDVLNAPDSNALVSRVASMPLMNEPGSEWHYSVASDLQGVIIERLTGESLQVFLKREVFDRLNMQDTGFFVPYDQLSRVSMIATPESGTLVLEPPEDLSEAAQKNTYFEGGHGLISSLGDYHRFLEMLRRGGSAGPIRILSLESVELITSNAIRYKGRPAPQRGYGAQSGMGFGFGVSLIENAEVAKLNAPKGTYYWYGALGSWFWVDPKNDIVFVGMIQTRAPIAPDLLAASMSAVYSEPIGYPRAEAIAP